MVEKIMIVLKKLDITDESEMFNQLERLANECNSFSSPVVRRDYDNRVIEWVNDFTGAIAFRKQRYLAYYLRKKIEYLNNVCVSVPQADGDGR